MKTELDGLTSEKKNLIIHHQKVIDFLKNKFEIIIPHNSISNNPINQAFSEEKKIKSNQLPINEQNKTTSVPMDIEEKNNEKKIIVNKKELT